MGKQHYHLVCWHTDRILFEGRFESMRECVEQAVKEGVNLDGVDMTGQNLACANLDDAQMCGARFFGANLNGANLSEGVFDNADFTGADFSYACFAVSSLMDVDFTGASFSVTDVTDAVIRGCRFSCPSVFTTLFHRAAVFSACEFMGSDSKLMRMDKPPITISGLPRDIVYLDDAVKIGTEFVSKTDLRDAGMAHLRFLYGDMIASFLYAAMGREKRVPV